MERLFFGEQPPLNIFLLGLGRPVVGSPRCGIRNRFLVTRGRGRIVNRHSLLGDTIPHYNRHPKDFTYSIFHYVVTYIFRIIITIMIQIIFIGLCTSGATADYLCSFIATLCIIATECTIKNLFKNHI